MSSGSSFRLEKRYGREQRERDSPAHPPREVYPLITSFCLTRGCGGGLFKPLSPTKAIGEDLLFLQVEKRSCSRPPGAARPSLPPALPSLRSRQLHGSRAAFLRRGEEGGGLAGVHIKIRPL